MFFRAKLAKPATLSIYPLANDPDLADVRE